MRRVVLLALLALALPVLSWANSSNDLVFTNTGGKITLGAGSTLKLSGSILTSFTGLNGVTTTGKLGTVNFTTGSLISGTISAGGTFAAGGSFTIMGNGSNGIPKGVLFTGSFNGPVTWTAVQQPKGNFTYTLSGSVSGKLSNGSPAGGGTVQFTFDVPSYQQFSTSVRLNNGVTTVTVPEPGTLGLLGTGLIGIAGLVRRKLKK